jgi:hypothetical protein
MRPPLGFLPNGEAVQNGYKALVAVMSSFANPKGLPSGGYTDRARRQRPRQHPAARAA